MSTPFDLHISNLLSDVKYRWEVDARPYQQIAFQFALDNPFSGLFIDMGLGKTATTLALIAHLLEQRSFLTEEKTLVVAPLKVALNTWPDEVRRWDVAAPFGMQLLREDDNDPRLLRSAALGREWARASGETDSKVIQGEGTKQLTLTRETIRRELARSPNSIHVINKERLSWLVEYYRRDWPYKTVIIDESSMFKDQSTEVFKALARVRKYPHLIHRIHLLSATPATEGYLYLWPQIFLLDGGQRLGKFVTHYRKRYFNQNIYTRKWELREGAESEIIDKIKDICIVMRYKDYLSKDDPLVSVRRITLSPQAKALYDSMENDFIVQLPDGSVVEAETAGILSQKLQQMASGVLYETYLDQDIDTDDMIKVRKVHHIHNEKIEELAQVVEETDGRPLLVGYWYKSSLDRLKKAFPHAVVMDKEGKCVKDWNAGKIKMLLVHPRSAGHGLNMQFGSNILVFFDTPWSLELFLQLLGRLDRSGQARRVLLIILAAVGTVDEVIAEAQRNKNDVQEKMFSYIRRKRKQAGIALRGEL